MATPVFKGGKTAQIRLIKGAGAGTTMVLSSGADASDFQRQIDTYEVTTYGDGDKNYIAGLRGCTLKFSGPFATTYEDFFAPILGSTVQTKLDYAPLSTVAGNSRYRVSSTNTIPGFVIPTNFAISAPVGGRVSWSVDLLISGPVKSTKY